MFTNKPQPAPMSYPQARERYMAAQARGDKPEAQKYLSAMEQAARTAAGGTP